VIPHQVFPLHVVGRNMIAIVIFSDNGFQDCPRSHSLLVLWRHPKLVTIDKLFQDWSGWFLNALSHPAVVAGCIGAATHALDLPVAQSTGHFHNPEIVTAHQPKAA
jgi:hypothetical protein